MKRTVTLLLLAQLAWHAQAQGTCLTALPIDLGTYTVPMVSGTEVPSPICAPNGPGATHGMWYSFTASVDTNITLTTDLAVNVGLDTRVHIYAGGCGALYCIAGDDDNYNYLSTVTFAVTAGATYLIAFDDRWDDQGFEFQVLETPPPPPAIIDFTAQPITATGLAFCVVDMNNDGLDDVVDVGPTTIRINYQQVGGGFQTVNITTTAADHPASWSMCAGDLDGNGYNDLMYGAGDGVTFMLASSDGTAFTEMSFPQYVFCQRTNMVDINNDGNLDAFSCHDVDANVYYLNDGLGGFTFQQGGLGETCGNYASVWLDIDNDADLDLFVAKCGCDPIDILYRNNGDGTFSNVAGIMGFADGQQSWSSAWADFDNDGDMDALVGTSTGDFQKLMRNDGTTFTNVTTGSGFDLASSVTNIDWVAHDFDNDGWVDVLGAATLFKNNGDMTFTQGPVLPNNGPVGDLNDDGYLDIQNGSTLYMNNGGSNHYLVVNTVGTVSNSNGIGARIQITSALGTQIRDVKSGDQFHFMSSLKTYFGLGADTEVDNLTIHWPSGAVSSIDDPAIDTTITVVEGAISGVQGPSSTVLGIYPSPVTDILHVSANTDLTGRTIIITDLAGKEVMRRTLDNGTVDVSALTEGAYLIRLDTDAGMLRTQFVKQ